MDWPGQSGWVTLCRTDFRPLRPDVRSRLQGPAPIPPTEDIRDVVTVPNGGAFYGDGESFKPELYSGSVTHGAELQLMDRRVYKSEFDLLIVKVKVLSNDYEAEVGKVGWVSLSATNFVKAGSLIGAPVNLEPTPAAAGLIGVVTSQFGDAIYGSALGYEPDDYQGRVFRGARLQLLDEKVARNQFGLENVKVKVLSDPLGEPVGKTVWVGLGATNFEKEGDVICGVALEKDKG